MIRALTLSAFLVAAVIPMAAQEQIHFRHCLRHNTLTCALQFIQNEFLTQPTITYGDGRHPEDEAPGGSFKNTLVTVQRQDISMDYAHLTLIYNNIETLTCAPDDCSAPRVCGPDAPIEWTNCITFPLGQLKPEDVYVEETLATWCTGERPVAECHKTETTPATYAVKIQSPILSPALADLNASFPNGPPPARIAGIFINRDVAYRVARYYRCAIELAQRGDRQEANISCLQ